MKEKTEENSLREEREREREIALPLYSLHQTSCIPFTSTCLRTEETPVPILQSASSCSIRKLFHGKIRKREKL